MKKSVLLLLLFLSFLQVPINSSAQRKDTGNWEIGFYKDAEGERGNPYYQVILPGFRFDKNDSVKVVVTVDYAVVNGFTISVLDDKNEPINLGWDVKVGFSENWRTDKHIKNFIQIDRTNNRGTACYVESQSQITKLADLLCKEDFAIYISVSNGNGGKSIYTAVVGTETKNLEEAVDNLLEMYKSFY